MERIRPNGLSAAHFLLISMPKLILIDDDRSRCEAIEKSLKKLNDPFFQDFVFLDCDGVEKYAQAIAGIPKDNSDKIVLLDLGFRDLAEDMWPSVDQDLCILAKKSQLRYMPLDIANGSSPRLSTDMIIDGDMTEVALHDHVLDGISILPALISASKDSKILIILISDHGTIVPLPEFLKNPSFR